MVVLKFMSSHMYTHTQRCKTLQLDRLWWERWEGMMAFSSLVSRGKKNCVRVVMRRMIGLACSWGDGWDVLYHTFDINWTQVRNERYNILISVYTTTPLLYCLSMCLYDPYNYLQMRLRLYTSIKRWKNIWVGPLSVVTPWLGIYPPSVDAFLCWRCRLVRYSLVVSPQDVSGRLPRASGHDH